MKGTSFNWGPGFDPETTTDPIPPILLTLASQIADGSPGGGASPGAVAHSLGGGAILIVETDTPLAPEVAEITLGHPLPGIPASAYQATLSIIPLAAIQPANPLNLAPGTVYWLADGVLHPLSEEQVTELEKWRTDPRKRASELKKLADRICEDMVFKPLEQLGEFYQDLTTWEGFKRRSWQTWEGIKGGAKATWTVSKSAWSEIVDGLTG